MEALERAGVTATCNPGGAGKWRREYGDSLRGARVVVVADRDDQGRAHAHQVAEGLDGIAASVELVEPVTGKDAADHLAAGRTVDEFTPPRSTRRKPESLIVDMLRRCPRLTTSFPTWSSRWRCEGR